MKFPHVIDNTLLEAYKRCPQYMLKKYLHGLHERHISIDLHFGSAFHAGLEAGRKAFAGGAIPEVVRQATIQAAAQFYGAVAVAVPTGSPKTLGRLLEALNSYLIRWPLGQDSLPYDVSGVEKPFQVPLGISHPETGVELVYGGRLDLLARDADLGSPIIVDDKTTKYLDSWMLQWDTSPQITGYIWAMEQVLGVACGAEVRGTAVGGRGVVSHAAVSIQRTAHQIQTWHQQMLRDVKALVRIWNEGVWDYRFGSACTAFGRRCEFTRMCLSPNPEQAAQEFVVEWWNPLEVENG